MIKACFLCDTVFETIQTENSDSMLHYAYANWKTIMPIGTLLVLQTRNLILG